jgi:selenocysteine-specific elongation factor
VLVDPGAWVETTVFDASIAPVRDLDRIPTRGAFKLYAGAAEVDATIRSLGEGFARVRTAHPLVLDPFDRFVIRDSGRRRTVGGGVVLDVAPPRSADARHIAFLTRRAGAARADLPALLVEERGAIRAEEVAAFTGVGDERPDGWLVSPQVHDAVATAVNDVLTAFHREHPLDEGAPLAVVREAGGAAARRAGAPRAAGLPDALLDLLVTDGTIVRTATTVRTTSHRVTLEERSDDVRALLDAISGAREPTPPTVKELTALGIPRDVIEAASRAGTVIRIAPDLVVAPSLVNRATAIVHEQAATGISVSMLRERLATSRKYAVPLAEWLDRTGVTVRRGDLRFPRT